MRSHLANHWFVASMFASFSLSSGCTEASHNLPRPTAPAANLSLESIAVSFAFSSEDLLHLEELHNGWQGFVNYFDAETTAPQFEKKSGSLRSDTPAPLGAIHRLARVQLGVDLFRDNTRVYHCESDVLNLAAVTTPTLAVALNCSRDASPAKLIQVNPVLVLERETIDVSISATNKHTVSRTLALATQRTTSFLQEGTFGGSPATISLSFIPTESVSTQSGTLTLSVLDKASGRSLVNASLSKLSFEDLSTFLSGKANDGLILSGSAEVLSHKANVPTTNAVQLPAQLKLTTKRGVESVNGSIETRLDFLAEFQLIDGSAPEKAEPFGGELVLLEEKITLPQKISIATYNVQGMGDDVGAGFPYDFSNKSSNWIKDKMYEVKAAHIAEALAIAGTPDVVALEEIKYLDGKGRPLELMWPHLQKLGYKYKAFGPQRPYGDKGFFPSDTEVIVSKWPIISVEGLKFDAVEAPGAARDPVAVNIDVGGSVFRLYAVHTKSKVSEKTPADAVLGNKLRRDMLALVRADIEKNTLLNKDLDIIVVGDMNADYFEDSIVNGLGTTGDESRMLAAGNTEKALFNLWYDLAPENRCNMSFTGERNCLDQINISSSLYDNSGLQYVDNSFRIAGFTNPRQSKLVNAFGTGARWQTKVKESVDPTTNKIVKFTTHLGIGYSDHFPIVADFMVVGKNNSNTRMTLSAPPAKEINHQKLYFHMPYCTDADGTFLPFEEVKTLSSESDLAQQENIGKCFELKDGFIPLKVVDTYDVRADYGFEFKSKNPFFNAVSITFQYDDRNTGGRVINRQALLDKFTNDLKNAIAAGKKVSLIGLKGRLDVNYGKLTLVAEEFPALKIED
jgi:endonuclease/exonuclease/phosphatase family metal-dependent hydrolase